MEIYTQMRKTALDLKSWLMISYYYKNWPHEYVCDWEKNLTNVTDASLLTNTNQVAFIQFTLHILYTLFKYAFYICGRVYGFLETLFGVVSFLPHSGSLLYLHQSMHCVISGRSYQGKVPCGSPSFTKPLRWPLAPHDTVLSDLFSHISHFSLLCSLSTHQTGFLSGSYTCRASSQLRNLNFYPYLPHLWISPHSSDLNLAIII